MRSDNLPLGDRRELAADPDTVAEALRRLAEDSEERVREAVASNSTTPTEVLTRLAGDTSGRVRVAVTRNPQTPKKTRRQLLVDLLGDASSSARSAAAEHPEVAEDLLALYRRAGSRKDMKVGLGSRPKGLDDDDRAYLANYPYGREVLAFRDDTAPEQLAAWADDESKGVRQRVAGNPATPPETLEQLANSPSLDVRAAVAGNASTPPGVLGTFVERGDETEVEIAVAGNPSAPVHILVKLSGYGVEEISEPAEAQLERLLRTREGAQRVVETDAGPWSETAERALKWDAF